MARKTIRFAAGVVALGAAARRAATTKSAELRTPVVEIATTLVLLVALCATTSGCAHSSASAKARRDAQQTRRTPGYARYLLQRIENTRAALTPEARLGVALVGEDGALLVDHHAHELFVPASTTKVLSGAAVLKMLGPAYRFVTEMCVVSAPSPKEKPELYLHTVGDPSLRAGDIAALASLVRAQAIEQIGRVWVDDSDFDAVSYGPGWMWDDLSEGYSAPVSASLIDENAVTLTILPGKREGDPLRVLSSPKELDVPVVVQGRTVGPRGPTSVRVTLGPGEQRTGSAPARAAGPVPQPDEPPGWTLMPQQRIVVSGTLPLDGLGRTKRLALGQPSLWSAQLLKKLLVQQGVCVDGPAGRAQTPDGCVPIARHSSAPLGTMLPVWMKASDNLAFEALGKRLGQVTTQRPGSFVSASQAIRAAIEDDGKDAGPYRLVDASGTSRYNLLSPKLLADVLVRGLHDFESGFELLASLPLAGKDGTLARRLQSHRGRVRAKTGTMTGVSSLAGVLEAPDGERMAFAIMLEGTLAPSDKLRLVQDHIVALMANEPTMPLGEPPN